MEIIVTSERHILKYDDQFFKAKKKYDIYIGNNLIKTLDKNDVYTDNKLIKNLKNVKIPKSGTIYFIERNVFNRKTWLGYFILFIIFFWPIIIISFILGGGIDEYNEFFFSKISIHNNKVEVIKIDYYNFNGDVMDIYLNDETCIVKPVESYKFTDSIKKIRFLKFKVLLFYIFNTLLWASVIIFVIYFIITEVS